MTSSGPVLMADVAKRARVSVMTVSRVLNGFPGVADPTRRRVEAAVAELGYRANTAARVLAGGRSRTLGVVAVESEQFGPSHMLFGIEAAARAAGHLLTFVSLRHQDGADMRSALEHLRTAHVDGVVVVAPVRPVVEAVRTLEDDLPLVVVGGDPSIAAATVTIDQREGARLATGHLLDLGHRTVHHVSGPRAWIDASARRRGWNEELRSRGVAPGVCLVGDWSARSGYAAGRRLAEDCNMTAVFAANDQMALGVIRALHEQGRKVPDDASVVGFDDTPESAFFIPSLTTIRQDFEEVGRRCVELLRSLLDGGPGAHVVVPARLITRNSEAPFGP